ncbi:hypothetical protein DFH08DRAFT_979371 [Mycena albidolilacea]|uniref:Ribonuclease H1 N-terminal domain-containing protein n=1 Tax=Mycena albidolilacea TaxID=1033008 RepID=A0AAD6YWV1_9AGAR|nr:hypothetical protein DFH08DRAFT_979371 [Mycena albidolilacea]
MSTNLNADEVIMDVRPGGRDSRYYCLPPFCGNSNPPAGKLQRWKFAFYLVSQGRVVGVFDDWLETQASVSGYLNNSFRGYNSMEDCINAWQALCRLGMHPHKVDPQYATVATAGGMPARMPDSTPASTLSVYESTPTSTSPHKSTPASASPGKGLTLDLKRFYTPPRAPTLSPQNGASSLRADKHDHLNFAIRGGGIVSSSA